MILCKNCSPRKECFCYQNGETRTECRFYQPMTEQEYIQTCNTLQLAEEISHLVFGGDFKKHISKMGYINMHSFKTEIVEWLKQPHREENEK